MVENFKQAFREVFTPKKVSKAKKQDVSSQEKIPASENENKDQEPEVIDIQQEDYTEPENRSIDVSSQEEKTASENENENQEPELIDVPQYNYTKEDKNSMNNQAASGYFEEKNTVTADQTTNIITKDTRIVGTITTGSKLIIEGEIEGGIESKNVVIVTGCVCGDIKCKSAEINNAQVDGNIDVSDRLRIKDESKIVGDLSGSDIEVSGCVNGNLNALQSVKLYSNACVTGNINSASISIETGAILQGNVNIKRE